MSQTAVSTDRRRTARDPLPGARRHLHARLAEARERTDVLFELVRFEALYDRPIPERHRFIFYLGHLEAFDANLLSGGTRHPSLDRLFAFGIDPTDGTLPQDRPEDWPSIAETREYGRAARRAVDAAARSARPAEQLLNVAIEHRLMHAETLAYSLNRLPLDRKAHLSAGAAPRAAPIPPPGRPAQPAARIEIPSGRATLGQRRCGPEPFGWDNEFDEHVMEVPAFAIDAHNVTNGEFLRFVQQGGYQDRSLWTEAAWRWIQAQGIHHPGFWVETRDGWHCRTVFSMVPLPASWPVYVSHAEASAYARWAGGRLPSEAQWHRAACGTPGGDERRFPWGDDPPTARHGNFGFSGWDPVPVGSFPAGASAFGVHDLVGNGWEWTSSVFAPFAGFEPFPFYPGYSADFFFNGDETSLHYVMKGASPRTASCLLRRSFRNWFQPHYPHMFAAFRLVE